MHEYRSYEARTIADMTSFYRVLYHYCTRYGVYNTLYDHI